jgi:hypothetical protein
MGLWDKLKSLYFDRSIEPLTPRRLDGRSKALLAASIKSCLAKSEAGSRSMRPEVYFRQWMLNMPLARWMRKESSISRPLREKQTIAVVSNLCPATRGGSISFGRQIRYEPLQFEPLQFPSSPAMRYRRQLRLLRRSNAAAVRRLPVTWLLDRLDPLAAGATLTGTLHRGPDHVLCLFWRTMLRCSISWLCSKI